RPEPARIERLVEQLASLGVPTPALPEQLSPAAAGDLAGEISRVVAREAARRGHGRDAYTSLVLRSLKQAYYSGRNLGHAGLGSGAAVRLGGPLRVRVSSIEAPRGRVDLEPAARAGADQRDGDRRRAQRRRPLRGSRASRVREGRGRRER